MKKECIIKLVNEDIYKTISLINEIEILKLILVCWMQNK
jgi:hypothetical protein